MMANKRIFEEMKEQIINSNLPESEKIKLLNGLNHLEGEKMNIMITGATGSGKSSTINALFGKDVAKVGEGADPETMDIKKYDLDNLILWDSPGLGDGKEKDISHAKNITDKLLETDEDSNLLIDLVIVILDGSSRDLGTSYQLINNVIAPVLGENKEKRLLIAINKADMAKSGRHWDFTRNKPDEKLKAFLDEKAESVRKRIKEGTGIETHPIYYSAGYKEDGEEQRPYNLIKLLDYIVSYTPEKKRLVIADRMNRDTEMWKDDDGLKDYRKSITDKFSETFSNSVSTGVDIGGAIGGIFSSGGEAVGRVIGGAAGAVVGFFGGLFNSFFG